MPMMTRARRRALVLALPFLLSAGLSAAQSAGQTRLLVGFPPGTGPDVVARLLAQKVGEAQPRPVVVENRAGAGGQIASQAAAKAAPDGSTLLLGEVGSISIAPAAFSKLPYEPARELAVLSEVVRSDFLLVVPAQSGPATLAEFLKTARAHKDRLNFATFGAGTPGHFGAEMLAEQGGFKIEPVHYRATGDAVTAIVAGDVQAAFVTTALGAAQIKAGKMRALATTAAARSPLLPEVPTFAEAGLPKVDFAAWFAVFAPAGTPAAQQEQWSQLFAAAARAPEVRQKLVEAGFTVVGGTRAEAERLLKAEAPRWAAAVKAAGFKGD
jgi:tripartite-type tricarboxylate transporter receptor subunit TctC